MAENTHLQPEQVERYLSHTLLEDEIAATYLHLEECSACQNLVSASAEPSAPFATLVTDALLGDPSGNDHLSADQYIAYADGDMDRIDRQILESHLETCSLCVEEIRNVRALRTMLSTYPAQVFTPATPLSLRQRLLTYVQRITAITALRLSAPALAAGLLVWLGASSHFGSEMQLLQNDVTQNAKRQQTQIAALQGELADQQHQSANQVAKDVQKARETKLLMQTVQKLQGEKTKLVMQNEHLQALKQSLQQSIHTNAGHPRELKAVSDSYMFNDSPALVLGQYRKSGSLPLPAVLADLQFPLANTAGSSADEILWQKPTPEATFVLASRITLHWKAVSDATSYRLLIQRGEDTPQSYSLPKDATTWTSNLPDGSNFTIQLQAFTGMQQTITSRRIRFGIIARKEVARLKHIEQAGADPLTLGLLYTKAGALDEAEKTWASISKSDPLYPQAVQLLAKLRKNRPTSL